VREMTATPSVSEGVSELEPRSQGAKRGRVEKGLKELKELRIGIEEMAKLKIQVIWIKHNQATEQFKAGAWSS
jgi:hypothetical protein